jgi:hypothetical protein
MKILQARRFGCLLCWLQDETVILKLIIKLAEKKIKKQLNLYNGQLAEGSLSRGWSFYSISLCFVYQ